MNEPKRIFDADSLRTALLGWVQDTTTRFTENPKLLSNLHDCVRPDVWSHQRTLARAERFNDIGALDRDDAQQSLMMMVPLFRKVSVLVEGLKDQRDVVGKGRAEITAKRLNDLAIYMLSSCTGTAYKDTEAYLNGMSLKRYHSGRPDMVKAARRALARTNAFPPIPEPFTGEIRQGIRSAHDSLVHRSNVMKKRKIFEKLRSGGRLDELEMDVLRLALGIPIEMGIKSSQEVDYGQADGGAVRLALPSPKG